MASFTNLLERLHNSCGTPGTFTIERGSKTYGRQWKLLCDEYIVFTAGSEEKLKTLIIAFADGMEWQDYYHSVLA